MALGTPDWGKYGVEAPGGGSNQSDSSDSTADQTPDTNTNDDANGKGNDADGQTTSEQEASGQGNKSQEAPPKKVPGPVPYDRFVESTRKARQLEAQYKEATKRTAELEAQLKLFQGNKTSKAAESTGTWLDDYLDEPNDGNGQGGQSQKEQADLVTLLREERQQRLAAQEQAKEAQGLAKVDTVLKGLEKDFGIPPDKALKYLAKDWTVEEVIEELAPHYHGGGKSNGEQTQRPLSRIGNTGGNNGGSQSNQNRPRTMAEAHAELRRLLGNA